jgi:quinol monooxygenase YgiN
MFARLAKFAVKPDMEDDVQAALQNQGVPAFFAMEGFVSLTVYLDRTSNEEVVISVWHTREQAETVSWTREWRDLVARLTEFLERPPRVHIFEVALAA